ncbi:hypothetical protein CPBF426_27370 [Xanthomonas arboricola pv. juglandis]|nr:hypothetical protein CPBF426_27370 [Xanthomonas arboricola pv. juglandis]
MVVQALAKTMWRPGYRYKKAGIGLLDLTAGNVHQGELFSGGDSRSKALMEVMDRWLRPMHLTLVPYWMSESSEPGRSLL